MAGGGRQLSYLQLHSIGRYDRHNNMSIIGIHPSPHAVGSVTSKLALTSYRLPSVLRFAGMSFGGLWAVTASFVSAESICSVLRRRDDHIGVLGR